MKLAIFLIFLSGVKFGAPLLDNLLDEETGKVEKMQPLYKSKLIKVEMLIWILGTLLSNNFTLYFTIGSV